ncbi:hypothetical protein B0H63DRAFT_555950 [Podospora didyma]|uniref:Glutaredoxin-like protein n=1 Tax=Podospora didyma TaxID=330526 RepID=A0AAE0P7J5_9PEZI|nr:hypothetical protein B0H63DRAFT_555950 [Podospora didyma]
MRATSRLLQSCRITLFTRKTCGLCSQARTVLSDVWDKKPFDFHEIDIVKPESKAWRDLYDFDVPVVSSGKSDQGPSSHVLKFWQIHISKAGEPAENPKLSSKAVKLMHRFSPDDVLAKMETVEKP